MRRSEQPSATGRTAHYNFDEWIRQHYGDVYRRQQRARVDLLEYQKMRRQHQIQGQSPVGPIIMFMMFVVVGLILTEAAEDNDLNHVKDRAEQKSNDLSSIE